MTPSSISVVIPAHNAARYLGRCLQALRESLDAPLEILVVDDGSTDETRAIALSFGVTVIPSERRSGPALARNLGAAAAAGNVLFFLDADVCVMPGTLSRIATNMDTDPQLDALIGSYDDHPAAADFLSQYRNLMHTFVHQTGAERASTFWSGCGAIRHSVFNEHTGFSLEYKRPAVEDIELGYRLCRAGRKVLLDRKMQVTHLKKWSFWGLVKTDMLDRGVPWTELILRDRRMPNDLNLQLSQRISVALVFVLVGLAASVAVLDGAYVMTPLLAIVFLMLARWWGEVGSHKRPRRAFAVLTSLIGLIVIVACTNHMFGLVPPLVTAPALLWLRHRYSRAAKLRKACRNAGLAFLGVSVCVALFYLPAHHLIFGIFAVVVLLGLMNSQFYIFLAGKRGVGFMLAAIPFHILFHFYNGLSFLAGLTLHYTRNARLLHNAQAGAASSKAPLQHTPSLVRQSALRPRPPILLGLQAKELAILALYVAMVTFAVTHYQQSEDEARAWMLCRSFPLKDLFLHILRYEGHPGLYYLLLWGLMQAGFGFAGIHWAFAAIASAAIYLLLRWAPFPFYLRALIPFGFVLGYQYAVVARSYVLFPLLAFAAAHLYRRVPAWPAATALVLALLANVSLHGTMVALGLGAAYAVQLLRQKRLGLLKSTALTASWWGAGIFATSILLVAFCVWPVNHASLLDLKHVHRPLATPISYSLVAPSRVPATTAAVPGASWNFRAHRLYLATIYPISAYAALAILFEALVALLLLQHKQLLLVLPFVLLACFLVFVFVRVWHTGLIWVTLLTILWAVWDQDVKPAQRHLQKVVAGVLVLLCVLQLQWTAHALLYETHHASYPAAAAASYLSTLPSGSRIDGNGIAFSLLPFFARYLFVDDGAARFNNHLAYPEDVSMATLTSSRLDVILLASDLVTLTDRNQLATASYAERHRFCGAPYFPNQPIVPVCLSAFEKINPQ